MKEDKTNGGKFRMLSNNEQYKKRCLPSKYIVLGYTLLIISFIITILLNLEDAKKTSFIRNLNELKLGHSLLFSIEKFNAPHFIQEFDSSIIYKWENKGIFLIVASYDKITIHAIHIGIYENVNKRLKICNITLNKSNLKDVLLNDPLAYECLSNEEPHALTGRPEFHDGVRDNYCSYWSCGRRNENYHYCYVFISHNAKICARNSEEFWKKGSIINEIIIMNDFYCESEGFPLIFYCP